MYVAITGRSVVEPFDGVRACVCVDKARQQPSTDAASTDRGRPSSNIPGHRAADDAAAASHRENTPRRRAQPPPGGDAVSQDGERVDAEAGHDAGLRPAGRRQRVDVQIEINAAEMAASQQESANSANVESQPSSQTETEQRESVAAADSGSGSAGSSVPMSENQLPGIPEVENQHPKVGATAEPSDENEPAAVDEIDEEDTFEDLPERAPYQDPPVFRGHTNYGFEFYPSWAEMPGRGSDTGDGESQNRATPSCEFNC